MNPWLEQCEAWLTRQYETILNLKLTEYSVRLRWLSADSILQEADKQAAQGLVIEDEDIGWVFFILPYDQKNFEQQVNQSIGLRSRLLREANYSGKSKAEEKEDTFGSWRVGIIWLVENDKWEIWQNSIQELRCESGMAEEISLDAVRVFANDVRTALDNHGLPRLLLNTRLLLTQSSLEAEKWISADIQISSEMENFSQQFKTARARTIAREMETQIQSYQSIDKKEASDQVRKLKHFCVKNFRNLEQMQIDIDSDINAKAQTIILFGPNGTGKSSFAEALSLASFKTSPRLEKYIEDKDIKQRTIERYVDDYLTPIISKSMKPSFIWGDDKEITYAPNCEEGSKYKYEGVILNQEDSLEFTEMGREDLAAKILKGYSNLADNVLSWLMKLESSANSKKQEFMKNHGLSSAIKVSTTAYNKLAQEILRKELQRPSSEFLEWLRYLSKMSNEDGQYASKLSEDWTIQQNNVVERLASALETSQKINAPKEILYDIREGLSGFDRLAKESEELRNRIEKNSATLIEQIDNTLKQIDSWGTWLASQKTANTASKDDSQSLKDEIENLSKMRINVESEGKTLRGRLELLDNVKQFISTHWGAHPDICPACNSGAFQRV